MKCQSLFSGKNKKKYFKMLSAEIIAQRAKQVTGDINFCEDFIVGDEIILWLENALEKLVGTLFMSPYNN